MKLFNKILVVFSLVVLSLGISSCKYKDFVNEGVYKASVEVQFDWSKLINISRDTLTHSMRLYFFPITEDGKIDVTKQPLAPYVFTSKKGKVVTGGTIKIMPGKYKAIWISDDSERVQFQNDQSFNDFSVFVDMENNKRDPFNVFSDPVLKNKLRDNSVKNTGDIDFLFSGSSNMIEIKEPSPIKQVLKLEPKENLWHYTVTIKKNNKLKYVNVGEKRMVTAALCGMASAFNPAIGQAAPPPSCINFSCSVTLPTGPISGDFYTFGTTPESTVHKLVLFFYIKETGKLYYVVHDVSDQVNEQIKDPEHIRNQTVNIVIDELNEPHLIKFGNQGNITVDPWKDVEEISIDLK